MVIYKSMIQESNTTVATFKSVNQAVEIEGKAQSELRKNGFSASIIIKILSENTQLC